MIQEIDSSLLEAPEQYILHQCNCLTNRSAGLAKSVFERFPYANIYAERQDAHVPSLGCQMGDIVVRGDGKEQRFVINALAQYYPGRPKYPDSRRDGYEARRSAFRECLNKVAKLEGITSIAFPDHIGCSMAGGDWTLYKAMIVEWADENPNIAVTIRRYG
jgi:O-acetyl-ADP-ribose deacetylase (regulator of RNase III)